MVETTVNLNDLAIGSLIGFGFGVFLEKGRFCFVSAFRDFIAYRDSRVMRGVMAGVIVMTIGIGLAYWLGTPKEHFWVPSFGLSGLIGGLVFGVGMTWAGGCASGSLYRAGEGYIHFWIAVAAMAASYVVFGNLFDSFFLPYYFGPLLVFRGYSPFLSWPVPPPVVSMGGIVALLLAYRLAVGNFDIFAGLLSGWKPSATDGASKTFWQKFKGPWDARLCGGCIGLLAVAWFVYSTAWSVTNPEARWVGYFLYSALGPSFFEANRYWSDVIFAGAKPSVTADMLMLAFLIIGSFAAASWSGDFKIRKPLPGRVPNAVLGGILMGFGSRMAPGCNISNTFSGLAMLSAHSLVVSLGLILGVYIATRIMFRDVGCAI